jgi:PEGA domain-containing protein
MSVSLDPRWETAFETLQVRREIFTVTRTIFRSHGSNLASRSNSLAADPTTYKVWHIRCSTFVDREGDIMNRALRSSDPILWMVLMVCTFLVSPTLYAENHVMGEIQFEGRSHVEKTSGVWVDGEYVGYLKELKGSKKVMLLPGEHKITVRQDGYQDFTERVQIQPGQKELVRVAMEKAPTGPLPDVTATVKVEVNPSRAAVFLDGLFVGHVGEFEGVGRGMQIGAGAHQIKIALPGYQTFETQINPVADQKVEIKTDLVKTDASLAPPLVKTEASDAATPAAVAADAAAVQKP